MHSLLEIIIPNSTKDISSVIAEIMKPFDENEEDSYYSFWDGYVIGGRFAGQKEIHSFDQEKVEEFYQLLNENKITVSSVQCGKQEISPPEQIPLVDKLWNDLFIENDSRPCPLFNHSNNQYDEYGIICGDIMPVKECLEFECGHLIIASLHKYNFKYDPKWKADYMIEKSMYNGVSLIDTGWDGKIKTAIEMFKKSIEDYNDDFKKTFDDIENWISVTVDYHS